MNDLFLSWRIGYFFFIVLQNIVRRTVLDHDILGGLYTSPQGEWTLPEIGMHVITILNISAEFHPTHPLEFSTVMQTLDFVLGLHSCFEFSQPLSCLYPAMQTRKTFSPGVILFTPGTVHYF